MHLLSRGDLIARMYKHFVVNKKRIGLALGEPVDYNKLRQTLNKLLTAEHQITENESITIHRNEDSVLIFLFYLAISLDIGELPEDQVDGILFSKDLLLPPMADYLAWKDGKSAEPPFYNMAINDGFYTFVSGFTREIGFESLK